MFYSQFILAKKGPLGTIWIAAHLERKLRKNQVADTDIGVSVDVPAITMCHRLTTGTFDNLFDGRSRKMCVCCLYFTGLSDSILCPDVPIALRLSSHLLLGVVRIYSRKVNYLFDDCSDALLKVKQAFRSTAVDLPPEQSKAPYHSITLPETFDLDDFELPDNEIFQGNDRHVSTREQITLQDTMDGVAFPTSQFGLDERFGDGDASQIGLDLDEDLFLEKGDAAGTSDVLNNTGADQSSAREATSFKDDEHSERDSDIALNSSTNYFNIQAPSTPGLMEEPDLPSAEEALVSDDHMDEDQNISELAAKDVSGTASSQVEPSYVHSLGLNSNGNLHQLDNEAVEATPVGDAQPFRSIEHIEATRDVDSSGNKLKYSPLQNEAVMVVDSQSVERDYDHFEADLNAGGNVFFAEAHDRDTCVDVGKADLNAFYVPEAGIQSENKNILVTQELISAEEIERVMLNNGYQCQNLENYEISKNNGSEKMSNFSTPVLKPCNSHNHNICEVEGLPDVSRLSAETDGLCSMGLTSAHDDTEILAVVQGTDSMMPTSEADQVANEGSDAITSTLDRPLDSQHLGDDYLVTENNLKASDFSAPEKLLSMPNLAAGQSDNLAGCTPAVEVVARDGDCIEAVEGDMDASFGTSISGKKRSYTESTLTFQSLNSAASSNADQSKQSVELVPEDDDLLSSILGGRSTAFKLKPTPPVSDRLPAKRQRSSVRSSALKRKVLLDDSMVLHGDMIREQLTNTEDIRRVRKKAPCTRLEVWVLQKQFLEDEVFSEPLFTGFILLSNPGYWGGRGCLRCLLPEFRCMHSQPRDLSRIIIVKDDGSKGTIETDTSSRLMYAEGVETETMMPFGAVDKGKQEHEVNALQKELETFDNEIAKQMSKPDVLGKKVETEICDQAGREGNQPVTSTAEPTSLVSLVQEVTCNLNNLNDNAEVDAPSVNETADLVMSEDIDASRKPINQDKETKFTREDVSTMEEVSGSGRENQEVDINVDEKSTDESLLEKRDGLVSVDSLAVMEDVHGTCFSPIQDIPVAVMEDVHDTCFSPIQDIPVAGVVDLVGEASPKADKIIEEFQLGECRLENEEEVIVSDVRRDDSCPMPTHFLEEDMKIDHSRMVESDLSSQDIQLSGREVLQFLETDPTLVTDPMAVPSDYINPADIPDLGTQVIEHDTDFLNVDDDDVDDDYEDDAINPEEKRMLDNSGWSSRTRAVANYLQVLFEKETQHAKMVIPLESLLVGKTRKEASRMFFETLVSRCDIAY
ncbi:hypothetical protein KSS87_022704, partial [Heliosperma pusillum]